MDQNNSSSKLQKIAVVFGCLVVLTMIAIPNFVSRGHKPPRQRNYCINILRQIDAAKQQWALDNNETNLDTLITWNDVKSYLGRNPMNTLDSIYCPEDKTRNASNSYTLGNLGSLPKCKINPAHTLP